jgi:hypothetical protein
MGSMPDELLTYYLENPLVIGTKTDMKTSGAEYRTQI